MKKTICIIICFTLLLSSLSLGNVFAGNTETLKYSLDGKPDGETYNRTEDTLNIVGWAFDTTGTTVKCYYSIDNAEGIQVIPITRNDVVSAFPDTCTQTDCGFNEYISIRSLSLGEHTFTFYAETAGSKTTLWETAFIVDGTEAETLNLKYSADFYPTGTYTYKTTEKIHLGGWAFNADGTETKCYYQIDSESLTELTPDNRQDVVNAYPDECKQLNCGYRTDISIADLGKGTHTYKVIAKCGTASQVIKQCEFTIIGTTGELKSNSDKIPSGTITLGSDSSNYALVQGWGYNTTAEDVKFYGQFDNSEKFYLTTEERKDVYNTFDDCYRTDCGYTQNVYLGNLSAGSHTMTVYIVSGEETAAVTTSSFVIVKPRYTVKFDANGGTGAPSAMVKTFGKNLNLPDSEPTRDGYVFKGWNTEKDGSGENILNSYKSNANATLYALWEPLNPQTTYDTDFTILTGTTTENSVMFNGTNTTASVSASADSVNIILNTSCGKFNYFGLKYFSSTYAQGTITYKLDNENYSEEFFLEPGENKEFKSFIDGIFDGSASEEIVSLQFEPLNSESFDFDILGIAVFNRKIPETITYIQNESIKIGLNMEWGGSLSYYEDLDSNVEAVSDNGIIRIDSNAAEKFNTESLNDNVNLINCHDTGRLVQQSYYGTQNYDMGYYNGHYCAYNPVQGGNMYNEQSKIVDLQISENAVYVKCRPLDWAKSKEYITDSYMEATYTLCGDTLKTECRFVDFSGYDSANAGQELPAFYGAASMDEFLYYGGSDPWTNGELSKLDGLDEYLYAHYPSVNATEKWGILTSDSSDEDCFSIGLFVPDCDYIAAGISGSKAMQDENPDTANPTSYLAGGKVLLFESFSPIEYDFYITTGTVNEIRNNFKDIAAVLDYETAFTVNSSSVSVNSENNFIYGIPAKTSEISNIISSKNGFNISTDDSYLGTGTIINVLNNNNKVIDTYTLIVTGDLDGDGICDVLDAFLAERFSSKTATPTNEQICSAAGMGKNEITPADYSKIVNLSLE